MDCYVYILFESIVPQEVRGCNTIIVLQILYHKFCVFKDPAYFRMPSPLRNFKAKGI